MEKIKLKSCMLLISFSVGLVLVVVHFNEILFGISFLTRLLTPLFIGIVIAYVLNRPCEFFHKWYHNKLKISKKRARILSTVTVYVLGFCALVLMAGIIFPELARNLKTFSDNAERYLSEMQLTLNRRIRVLAFCTQMSFQKIQNEHST